MKLKAQIMDEAALNRALMRIAHEITEKNKGVDNVVLVGIRRRGEPIAQIIRRNIEKIEGVDPSCGSIDIGFYRDDLSTLADTPLVRRTELPFDVTDRDVVLVDDVLYTGRTARAAIEAVFSCGRPKRYSLPCWWIAGTANCRYAPITSARTSPPPEASLLRSAFRNTTARPACS